MMNETIVAAIACMSLALASPLALAQDGPGERPQSSQGPDAGPQRQRPADGFGGPPPEGGGRRPPGPGGPGMQGHGGPGMQGPGGPGMQGPGASNRAPGPPPDWEPSADLVAQVKKAEPDFAAALDRWKVAEPPRWRMELFQWEQEQRHVESFRARGETERAVRIAKTGALERRVRVIIDGMPRDEGDAHDTARQQVRAALSQLFDLRETMRSDEIGQLEKRIVDLKAGLAERRASKDEIVGRRLKELFGGEDPLGW